VWQWWVATPAWRCRLMIGQNSKPATDVLRWVNSIQFPRNRPDQTPCHSLSNADGLTDSVPVPLCFWIFDMRGVFAWQPYSATAGGGGLDWDGRVSVRSPLPTEALSVSFTSTVLGSGMDTGCSRAELGPNLTGMRTSEGLVPECRLRPPSANCPHHL
jgi:hypothetical protein